MSSETSPMAVAVGRGARRWTLPRAVAFWLVAVVLGLFLFAAAAPSPLYVVYQANWEFSATVLTTVFAVYALFQLLALVFAGSLSDHIGRRPVILAALALEVVAMGAFAGARNVTWLLVARILQGAATGLAAGTLSAALLDLQPTSRPRVGPTVASIMPMAGLAVGALGSGLLVQYGPFPTQLVFWLLLALLTATGVGVATMPETVASQGPWLRFLRPHVTIPAPTRALFVTLLPCIVATWALGGLYLSLGSSVAAQILGASNHLVGGLIITTLAGIASVTSTLTAAWPPGRTLRGGSAAVILGVGVTLLAIRQESTALFFLGTMCAGLGFGPTFSGAFRALVSLSSPDQRAGFIAAIYVVSYLGFSLPVIAAGAGVTRVGLGTTAIVYGLSVMVLVAVAAAAYTIRTRHPHLTTTQKQATAAPPPCPGTAHPCPDTRP